MNDHPFSYPPACSGCGQLDWDPCPDDCPEPLPGRAELIASLPRPTPRNVPGFAGFVQHRTPEQIAFADAMNEAAAQHARWWGAAAERKALLDWAEAWDVPLQALHVIATESQMPPISEMIGRLPKIGTKNWVAWVAQLTDDEIERMNAAREA